MNAFNAPVPQITARELAAGTWTHMKANLPQIAVMAAIGAAVSYFVNVYWIASKYEGSNVPDGAPVTAGGNMIWGILFWVVASSLIFGVVGHRRRVGGPQFWADVQGLPESVQDIFRADGVGARIHLLWGFAVSLILTQVLSPSLRGILAVGVALTVPSVLGRVVLSYVSRVWSAQMRRFNPGKAHAPQPPLVSAAVTAFGVAAALLIGFIVDDTTIEIVLALAAAGGAFMLGQQTQSPPPTAVLLMIVGGIAAYIIVTGDAAFADDGGKAECGGTWSEWWDMCEGAGRVRRDAGVGAVAGGIGAGVGSSVIPGLVNAAGDAVRQAGSTVTIPDDFLVDSNESLLPPEDGFGQLDPNWEPPPGDEPPTDAEPDPEPEPTPEPEDAVDDDPWWDEEDDDSGGGTLDMSAENEHGGTTSVHISPDGTETTTVTDADGNVISRTVVPGSGPRTTEVFPGDSDAEEPAADAEPAPEPEPESETPPGEADETDSTAPPPPPPDPPPPPPDGPETDPANQAPPPPPPDPAAAAPPAAPPVDPDWTGKGTNDRLRTLGVNTDKQPDPNDLDALANNRPTVSQDEFLDWLGELERRNPNADWRQVLAGVHGAIYGDDIDRALPMTFGQLPLFVQGPETDGWEDIQAQVDWSNSQSGQRAQPVRVQAPFWVEDAQGRRVHLGHSYAGLRSDLNRDPNWYTDFMFEANTDYGDTWQQGIQVIKTPFTGTYSESAPPDQRLGNQLSEDLWDFYQDPANANRPLSEAYRHIFEEQRPAQEQALADFERQTILEDPGPID